MMGEPEIIKLIQQRDQQGMDELLRHYGPLMRYIIAPILTDPREQEECLHDAAMRVWDQIGRYDPDRGSWKTWLSVLTRNTALNRARKTENHQELTPDIPAPNSNPEDIILQKERQNRLRRAILDLSREEQALFYRKYYYLQPIAQIAAELGTTERAVEGRLYRLKKQLRNRLGGDWHD